MIEDGKRKRNDNKHYTAVTIPGIAEADTLVDEEVDTVVQPVDSRSETQAYNDFIDEPTPITEVESISPVQTLGVENSKFIFPLTASEELGNDFKAATCNENYGEYVQIGNILVLADTDHGVDPSTKCAKQFNDDGYLIIPDKKTICVFDGVGTPGNGYIATNIAAYFLLKSIQQGMPPYQALDVADAAIKQFQKSRETFEEIGTGALIAAINDENDKLTVDYSGDCQIFVIRKGVLVEAPLPQNMYHEKLNLQYGGDIELMRRRMSARSINLIKKVIMSSLGAVSTPIHLELTVHPGDLVFMCSDGYTDSFDSNEEFIAFFKRILASCDNDFHRACISLKQEIINRMKKIPGEGDNLTQVSFEIPS